MNILVLNQAYHIICCLSAICKRPQQFVNHVTALLKSPKAFYRKQRQGSIVFIAFVVLQGILCVLYNATQQNTILNNAIHDYTIKDM